MKRNIIILLVLLLTVFSASKTYAYNERQQRQQKIAAMTEEQKVARLQEIKIRIEEIQYMDKSTLSGVNKKALRQELRGMGKEAKDIQKGGVYLSFGAVVVVIGLLIILL